MTETTHKLTPKGLATRARIVEAAAQLIYERGVHGTNNELLRRAASVSGSQLNHYFPDKESWVRAVIQWRADNVIALHRREELGELDSLEALRRWADSYIGWEPAGKGGCGYGSLAAEIIKTDLAVHDDLQAGFERWEELFRRGLRKMRDRGVLRPDANPDHLTHVVMAAFQGGMLLAQAAGDVAPLRDALDGALAYIATFTPAG
ncbi:TetR/AcrR family transcriptional regulator [Actinophytocola sp.]|uniref:TetR/AcrR family transcriptional regulator n=1 Tax=Actinophytocola sp. TaxID=1872138 RepID=UPI0025B8A7EF|nr:TetR/AcrR family transcriptional regulator [Actinophytocola sp.]